MPNINNVVPPEYAGKKQYTKGDKESIEEIQSIFKASKGKYKIVILDPSVVSSIPHAPTFFDTPQLPANCAKSSQVFENGADAYSSSRAMLDSAIREHIGNGNQNFNMYAMIVSESESGGNVVQGFIQADVNKFSTNYFFAKSPNPQALQIMNEPEMVD